MAPGVLLEDPSRQGGLYLFGLETAGLGRWFVGDFPLLLDRSLDDFCVEVLHEIIVPTDVLAVQENLWDSSCVRDCLKKLFFRPACGRSNFSFFYEVSFQV